MNKIFNTKKECVFGILNSEKHNIAEISRATGISRSQLTKWKSGADVSVRMDSVYKLVQHLNLDVEFKSDQIIINNAEDKKNQFNKGGKMEHEILYEHINLLNPKNIYIDNASIMPGALINAENGAVIIDIGVSIYGQTYIEGPAFIGANTIINPLTKIKKAIIGQKCKIGGELDSSIIQGYTNKAHDGHLGNSFLGEWVNLGAGTTNSNLKNNYSPVKVHINNELVDSKSLHVGCFVGDHVKTAIGTLINTGSVIGAASMIASYGFIPKTLPPFSWYINKKHQRIDIDKFILTAEIVKKRRNKNFSRIEKELYKKIANS